MVANVSKSKCACQSDLPCAYIFCRLMNAVGLQEDTTYFESHKYARICIQCVALLDSHVLF